LEKIKWLKDKLISFIKNNYIVIMAVITLLIPDILTRSIIPYTFNEPYNSIIPLLFSLCWTALIISLIRRLPSKAGRFVYLAFGLASITFCISNYIYYRIFGRFFWLSGIGLAGEAKGYVRYALGYLTVPLVVVSLVFLAFLIFVCIKWKPYATQKKENPDELKRKRRKRYYSSGIVIPVSGLLVLHMFMQPAFAGIIEIDWDSWNKPQVVYKEFTDVNKSLCATGIYHFAARDFWKSKFPYKYFSDEEYDMVTEYFNSRPKPEENAYSSIFEGKNVIAVMMESMDDWMISEKYTPTICYMMENGINFTDYYAPTVGSGYTFNSEFAFITGFYTPESAATAVNFSSNSFPGAVARLFRKKGYSVNSFHYNNPEFYNRGIMHNSFGFEKYNSFMDYDMTSSAAQSDSNILFNDAIYADMIKSQPFFDFLITYSPHIPYTYDDSKLDLAKRNHPDLIEPQMDKETNNLLILARDTDDFFHRLLKLLHEDGILENTVIIGFADHYAYGFSDEKKLAEYSDGLLMKVPAFIYAPGLEPVKVTKPVQTIDWLPTIINMFGLENSNCYIGNDMFDNRVPGFVHFPDSLWYDGTMYYIPEKFDITPENDEYIKKQTARADKLIEINEIVITGDYFKNK